MDILVFLFQTLVVLCEVYNRLFKTVRITEHI